MARSALTPEKLEMNRGKLLGLLLENLGADAAVRLGNPDVWREAVRNLPTERDKP